MSSEKNLFPEEKPDDYHLGYVEQPKPFVKWNAVLYKRQLFIPWEEIIYSIIHSSFKPCNKTILSTYLTPNIFNFSTEFKNALDMIILDHISQNY